MKAAQAEERRRTARRRTFKLLLDALKMAAAPAAVLRFDDLARCYETSVAGARVLTRRGVEARLLPVFLTVTHEQERRGMIIGASDEEAAGWTAARVDFVGGASEDRFHVLIEAEHEGLRALIDLTAGQARVSGADIPLAVSVTDFDLEASPMVALRTEEDWCVAYYRIPSPRAEHVRAGWTELPTAFADDLNDLTKLALSVDLDRERFIRSWYRGLLGMGQASCDRAMGILERINRRGLA